MKKLLLTTAALIALAASPAFAKTHHSQAMDAQASAESSSDEPGYLASSPNAVIDDGQVVGVDPDPNIRFQLLRDHGLPAN
ncbi:MAG TPA: hypothetical protein VGC38_09110 [Pseudolabrys sp.]